MFKYKSDLENREVEITPKSIQVYFLDDQNNIALEIPSAKELQNLKYEPKYKISIPHLTQLDPFKTKDSFLAEREKLLKKIDKYSSSSNFFVNLANLSELAGEPNRSVEYLKAAEKLSPSVFIKHEIGDRLFDSNDFNLAKEYINSTSKENDSYSKLQIARILTLNNEIEDAKKLVETAIKIDGNDYSARMFHGTINIWLKNFELAIRDFRVAISINPKTSIGYTNLAAAYWGLGSKEKAYKTLTKAIFLNPFNENAVCFLAEAANILNLDKEAIPALEYYLTYEQKNDYVWSLIARSYYTIGKSNKDRVSLSKSKDALRHQEGIKSTPEVWNNLAIIDWALKNHESAVRYLNYSIKISLTENKNIAVQVFNLTGLMIEQGKFNEMLQKYSDFVKHIKFDLTDNYLLDKIKLQQVILLEGNKERELAAQKSIALLSQNIKSIKVKFDLILRIIHYYTNYSPNIEVINKYKDQLLDIVKNCEMIDKNLKMRAINNLIFTFLTFNLLDDATELANLLSPAIHIDPFPTATLGMYKIRHGDISKGSQLYEDAISLLDDKKYKRRFRQRLNFEIGLHYLKIKDDKKALRHFNKATQEKDGYTYLNKSIKTIIDSMKLISLDKKTPRLQ